MLGCLAAAAFVLAMIAVALVFRCAAGVVASCPVCGRGFEGSASAVWDAVDDCVMSHGQEINMLF